MAKIGRTNEKPFNPISGRVLADLTGPVIPPSPEPPPRSRSTTPAMTKPARVEGAPIESERLERTKRFKLTQSEEIEIDEAIQRLSSGLRMKINFSHIARCLWQIYLHHEQAILDRAQHGLSTPRPHNADAKALAQFEDQLRRAVTAAIAASGDLEGR